MNRRLSAILAADVVGYSRLMEVNETGTLAQLKTHRKELFDPRIAAHHGRIVKLMGDGVLVEFPSVVEALQCAVEIQRGMAARNADVSEDWRIQFRIGINLGDIIVEGDDIYGDGVNVAARLEGLAEPGGICVSRAVRDQVRDKLDLTLEDLGEVEVKNLARPVRAFRLAGDGVAAPGPGKLRRRLRRRTVVTVAATAALAVLAAVLAWDLYLNLSPPAGPASVETPGALPTPGAPSIAVLPFNNMSGDPEQEYFSDGITEDLITDLSRISGLFVIARNTVFTYKGAPVKVQRVAEELGVRYVLEGSVRKAGQRVRINAQLVDARTGHHLWAERYDRDLTDVFALQDEVVQKIVAALAVELTSDEEERLSRSAQAHPEAYDMLLRGLERVRRFSRETNAEARDYFERAIALDPTFARAHADVAFTHTLDAQFGWSDDPEGSISKALEMAQHAMVLDSSIREVHFVLSGIFRILNRHDESIAAAQRAITLDPNYADAYGQLAMSLNYAVRPDEGLATIRKAMQLNPRHPFFYVWILGQAYYLLGRFEDAAKEFERVKQSNPEFPAAHLMLAATYIELGRVDDAEWAAAEVETLIPDFSLARERELVPYKDAAVLNRYIDNLRKAGLRE